MGYTKEEVVKAPFLFVSYKHEDSNVIVKTIDFLFECGVRFWYDKDLVTGDNWAKIAEELIKHENCKGVIFFNSTESFLSDPVFRERKFTCERIKKCEKEGKPFFVFPVTIGKPSTLLLLKEVFAKLPTNASEIERSFSLENLETIISLFGSDTIYCFANDEKPEEYQQKLIENIKKALPSVIDSKALTAKEFAKSFGESRTSIYMGLCMGASASSLPEYLLSKDQRVEYGDSTYFVSAGKAYQAQRICWRPIYCDDDTFFFLSENIVDFRFGGDELNKWLATDFANIAFSENEREAIREIRLLTEVDIAESKDENLLKFENCDSHWWIDSRVAGALQKVVKKEGTIYSSGYNFRAKRSGVRPVIRVDKEFIKKTNNFS